MRLAGGKHPPRESVANKNNAGLKFQSDYIEGMEGHGLNITGRKQAQTMNKIVEVI